MALPASGALSMSAINTEFGRGNNLNSYRGTSYYLTASGPFTFSSGAISFNNFYGTQLAAPTYSSNYVVVAGGGGGSNSAGNCCGGGAGGAGGMKTGSLTLSLGTLYTVTVGGGGAGSNLSSGQGSKGTTSVFGSISTTGGGGGGIACAAIMAGGSGGGSRASGTNGCRVGGVGVSGEGNNGGRSFAYNNGGGGGGKSTAGGTSNAPSGGNGVGPHTAPSQQRLASLQACAPSSDAAHSVPS